MSAPATRRDAIVQVMKTNRVKKATAPQIYDMLLAKDWTGSSSPTLARAYIAKVLLSSPNTFERVGRGMYSVKKEAQPAQSAPKEEIKISKLDAVNADLDALIARKLAYTDLPLPASKASKAVIDTVCRVTRKEAIELTDAIIEELQRPNLRLAVVRAYVRAVGEYLVTGEKVK